MKENTLEILKNEFDYDYARKSAIEQIDAEFCTICDSIWKYGLYEISDLITKFDGMIFGLFFVDIISVEEWDFLSKAVFAVRTDAFNNLGKGV